MHAGQSQRHRETNHMHVGQPITCMQGNQSHARRATDHMHAGQPITYTRGNHGSSRQTPGNTTYVYTLDITTNVTM